MSNASKKINVHFVTNADENHASFRIRIKNICLYINSISRGVSEGGFKCTYGPGFNKLADILVFSKHFNTENDLQTIKRAKDEGVSTIFDICDEHFSTPQLSDYYHEMTELADVVTVSTPLMKTKVLEVFPDRDETTVKTVKDYVTFDYSRPKPLDPALTKFVWFGHSTNIFPIIPLTHFLGKSLTLFTDLDLEDNPATIVKWEPGVCEKNLKYFDISLIPTRKNDDRVKYKSPNRLIDSIWSGAFVITNNSDIYGEFKNFCWIGDIQEGIQFALDNPLKCYNMVLAGQKYIEDNYTIEWAAKGWLEVFYKLSNEREQNGTN